MNPLPLQRDDHAVAIERAQAFGAIGAIVPPSLGMKSLTSSADPACMGHAKHVRRIALGVFALIGACAAGCATSPQSPTERAALADESRSTLSVMQDRDPYLKSFLEHAAGYAVFPNVGKGGVIVGGAFGRGGVYDAHGTLLGYAKVTQGSVGGVIGAKTYALLLVFRDSRQLESFKGGQDLHFGAEASAIAISDGCSATTRYIDGVAVFAMPKGGLMADASLNGQAFAFEKRVDPGTPQEPSTGTSSARLQTE
jgi:lipid-binding SYLF domain-containing protein